VQADSIVPDGVQGYDRYAYGLNNPSRYRDPSGHKACEEISATGKCTGDKFARLLEYVRKDLVNDEWQVKQKYTALQAMNLIVGRAASIYGTDWKEFLEGTNFIFLGTGSNGPAVADAHWLPRDQSFHGITFASGAGDSGFQSDFTQLGDNQVRHFWASFATATNGELGELVADRANIWHDVIEDWLGHADTTYSDFTLSLMAIDIGHNVHTGAISSPAQLPGVFEGTIGLSSPGYTGPDWLWLFVTPYK
jgi:hypothetical protein